MRYLFVFVVFAWQSVFAENVLYTANEFVLRLQNNEQFVFYPEDFALKTHINGAYLWKHDSLLLTTHSVGGETVIFAIFIKKDLVLEKVYGQNEFNKNIPVQFFLLKEMYENGRTANEYIWENKTLGNYKEYQFNSEGMVLAILNFENFVLEGQQVYFFNNGSGAMEKELNYKAGLLHGKSYYFQKVDEKYMQVALLKEEKYKNGVLVKSKTPATPPIFYTSHF